MPVKRFGPRYGLTVKKRLKQVEISQKKKYECPACLSNSAKRLAAGIWQCKKCKAKFTGSSYSAISKTA